MQGAIFGGSFGAIAGGINGWRNPRVCFVAGTQVVVGLKVEEEDGRIIELSARELARRQAAEVESGGVATALKIVGYVTAAIETLQEGDYVISRDQDDPDGPLVASRISRKYRRIADHLQLVGIRDGAGAEQLIQTTDEHPFFVPGQRWTKSKLLETGDGLLGPAEIGSCVTGNARQSHPAGVVVYNMEVAGSHTYFVRAEASDAEPVWVHNANAKDYNLAPRNAAERQARRDFLESEWYEPGRDARTGGISPNQIGAEGEAITRALYGEKNTKNYSINGRVVRPDHVLAYDINTRQPSIVVETKNVWKQHLSTQLLDDVSLVGRHGLVILEVPPNAKVYSTVLNHPQIQVRTNLPIKAY